MPETTFTATKKDLADAARFHARRVLTGRTYVAVIGGIALTVGSGILLISLFEGRSVGIALLSMVLTILLGSFLAWGLLFLLYALIYPPLTGRAQSQRKWLQEPITLAWSKDGIELKASDVASKVAWSHYIKWDEADGLFLLYIARNTYQFMPRRIFSDDAEIADVRRFLRDAGIPKADFWNS